jgi:vacuolar-type H+-ATPase subunit E/Vma4
MLRETLEAKINKIRREMQVTYMPIEVERLEAQIMAIRWVQARIQDIVINNNHGEDKTVR